MEVQNNISVLLEAITLWGKNRDIIDNEHIFQQLSKVYEEMGEVAKFINRHPSPKKYKYLNLSNLVDSIGDTVIALTLLARCADLDIKDCVYYAFKNIQDRTGKIENGVFIKD